MAGTREPSDQQGVYTHLLPGGGVVVGWGIGTDQATELTARFDHAGNVTSVGLSLPGPITPTKLQRFAWSRWLAVADTANRWVDSDPDNPWSPEAVDLDDSLDAAAKGRRSRPRPTHTARPGRKGHPESHYRKVADFYKELRRAGVRNPTETIAEEWGYNRNTVAGWLGAARKRGLLPPAKPGRPG